MMDPQDLAYLQAELAQAQSLGSKMLSVRTKELQTLLDSNRELAKRPIQPVRITGYARSSEIQMMKHGKLMTMRVRRVPNEWTDQPVYIDPKEIVYATPKPEVLPVE
jgi:DNA polymerase/3'-5' exonuclease PolX